MAEPGALLQIVESWADRGVPVIRRDVATREATARKVASLRSDLDHLIAIAESLEACASIGAGLGFVPVGTSSPTVAEASKPSGILRARVSASPVRLPAMEAHVFARPASLAVLNDVWQKYRDVLPEERRKGTVADLRDHPGDAARAELYGKIRDLRAELLVTAANKSQDDGVHGR